MSDELTTLETEQPSGAAGLIKFDDIKQKLAVINSPEEIKSLRGEAAVIEVLGRRQGNREIQFSGALGCVRCDQRLAQIANEMQERGELNGRNGGKPSRDARVLEDLEIRYYELNRCRKLLAIPEDTLQEYLSLVQAAPEGELTIAGLLRFNSGGMKPKSNYAGDIYTPHGMDACQTPAYALDPVLPYLCRDWTIWEPAAGEGLLVEALYDAGYSESQVEYSDILAGQNFFDYEPEAWDCLVTNPPYSIKYQWLERCYALGKPFALLLPVEAIGAMGGQVLFEEFGVEVIFVRPRINFKMPYKGFDGSAAQFPTAWFTWGLNIGRQITFAKVNPDAD